jgi:uncharacterized membrane protein YphA (DoxX/SURF4 family)
MKDAFSTNHWIKTHGDLVLDLIRIYLGLGLLIKGVFLMFHQEDLLHMMDTVGSMWFAPAIVAHYVILAHLVGGVCLSLGLLTRTAALVQVPVVFGALFYLHLPQMLKSLEARQSTEFAALVLFLLVLISVYGAGRWSLDHVLAKKEFEKLFAPEPQPAKSA